MYRAEESKHFSVILMSWLNNSSNMEAVTASKIQVHNCWKWLFSVSWTSCWALQGFVFKNCFIFKYNFIWIVWDPFVMITNRKNAWHEGLSNSWFLIILTHSLSYWAYTQVTMMMTVNRLLWYWSVYVKSISINQLCSQSNILAHVVNLYSAKVRSSKSSVFMISKQILFIEQFLKHKINSYE